MGHPEKRLTTRKFTVSQNILNWSSFFSIFDALKWGFYCQNQKKFLLITVPEAQTIGNIICINKDFDNLILVLNNCRCPTHAHIYYMFVLNSVVRICLDIWCASLMYKLLFKLLIISLGRF